MPVFIASRDGFALFTPLPQTEKNGAYQKDDDDCQNQNGHDKFPHPDDRAGSQSPRLFSYSCFDYMDAGVTKGVKREVQSDLTSFDDVAALAERMAVTGSRLTKRAEIAAAILAVQTRRAEDVPLFALYLAGLPFAAADARKLNAGGALLTRAVVAISGASEQELHAAFRRYGDMGSAAQELWAAHDVKGGPGLTLVEVEAAFAGMATAKTTAIRAGLVDSLLRAATPLEAKYLLKLMLGDMRIGVKESLVEEGIAVAAGVDVAALRHAVMLEADLGAAAQRAFAGTLSEARMRLFHPLGFMLASPVETPEEAIERFTAKPPKAPAVKKPKRRKKSDEPLDPAMAEALANDREATLDTDPEPGAPGLEPETWDPSATSAQGVHAFLEDKFDGMRAQLHFGAAEAPGRVALYSRNREDITESFPELVEAFAAAGDHGPGIILDGEILGWDYASATALPFAVMGQRIGRKRVDNAMRQAVPVVFMAFDILFADGELQLHKPLRERRNRLEALAEELLPSTRSPLTLTSAAERAQHPQGALLFDAEPAAATFPRLMLSTAKLVESAEEIDRAYADARARANEGVMLKAAGSVYQPGRRGLAWVKLKRELATLDVVITGAEYGHGRKAPFLSDYTFAVRADDGELLNVGKAYSGVTDAEITELTEFLKAHTLDDQGFFRTVEPLIVLEVAFNNIMRSDRHASGFALRFPRILHIRRDKPVSEIDTVARVEEIYQSQVDKPSA